MEKKGTPGERVFLTENTSGCRVGEEGLQRQSSRVLSRSMAQKLAYPC
jgi:hypothetical protein